MHGREISGDQSEISDKHSGIVLINNLITSMIKYIDIYIYLYDFHKY